MKIMTPESWYVACGDATLAATMRYGTTASSLVPTGVSATSEGDLYAMDHTDRD
jgi:hypothetical protein